MPRLSPPSPALPVDRVAPAWLAWLGFVVLCNGAGILSALVGTDASLYATLVRPSWSPPGWLFGPAWTALYTMMGSATYLVWRRTEGRPRRQAMTVFAVQLALNVSWTPVFFGLQRYGLALIVIGAVLVAVIVMMIVYGRRVRTAGLLIAPLAAWVGFASALNAAIWWLNR